MSLVLDLVSSLEGFLGKEATSSISSDKSVASLFTLADALLVELLLLLSPLPLPLLLEPLLDELEPLEDDLMLLLLFTDASSSSLWPRAVTTASPGESS